MYMGEARLKGGPRYYVYRSVLKLIPQNLEIVAVVKGVHERPLNTVILLILAEM